MNQFREFWENRLTVNFDLTGVGHSGLPYAVNDWMYRARRRVLLRELAALGFAPSVQSVIEVGCGTGFYTDLWAALGVQSYLGSDLTEVAVRKLAAKYPGYRFAQADITEQGLDLGRADLVVAFDVLFHIVDDGSFAVAIANLSRHCVPGGVVLISDNFLAYAEDPGTSHYQRNRSWQHYQKELRNNGLEVVRIVPQFVFLNTPLDISSPWVRKPVVRAWKALMRLTRISPRRVQWLIGGVLYWLDAVLLLTAHRGRSSKLLIARKTVSAADGG